MKKLHIYTAWAFIRPLFTSFFVVLFILVLQFVSRYKDQLFGKGFEALEIAKVFFFASAKLVVLALPLAVLLSSLISMGNLGESYQLAAMKSAGLSLFRTMRSLIVVTLLVVSFSLSFSFYVVPKANLKLYSLLYDLQRAKPSFNLKSGHFYNGIEGYNIRISGKKEETNELLGVMIYDHTRQQGNNKVVLAESGFMYLDDARNLLQMTLFKGVSHESYISEDPEEETYRYGRFYFDTLVFRFDLSDFGVQRTEEARFSSHEYMQDLFQLQASIDSVKKVEETKRVNFKNQVFPYLPADSAMIMREEPSMPEVPSSGVLTYFDDRKALPIMLKSVSNASSLKRMATVTGAELWEEGRNRRKYQIEYHEKFSLPISCLIFLLIGAPLGAIIRKGGIGMPVLISMGLFILFWVLMIQGKKLARDDVLPVIIGVWLPCLVMSPLAIFFTYESSTDSQLLSSTFWSNLGVPFRYLFNIIRRKKKEVNPETHQTRIRQLFRKELADETDYIPIEDRENDDWGEDLVAQLLKEAGLKYWPGTELKEKTEGSENTPPEPEDEDKAENSEDSLPETNAEAPEKVKDPEDQPDTEEATAKPAPQPESESENESKDVEDSLPETNAEAPEEVKVPEEQPYTEGATTEPAPQPESESKDESEDVEVSLPETNAEAPEEVKVPEEQPDTEEATTEPAPQPESESKDESEDVEDSLPKTNAEAPEEVKVPEEQPDTEEATAEPAPQPESESKDESEDVEVSLPETNAEAPEEGNTSEEVNEKSEDPKPELASPRLIELGLETADSAEERAEPEPIQYSSFGGLDFLAVEPETDEEEAEPQNWLEDDFSGLDFSPYVEEQEVTLEEVFTSEPVAETALLDAANSPDSAWAGNGNSNSTNNQPKSENFEPDSLAFLAMVAGGKPVEIRQQLPDPASIHLPQFSWEIFDYDPTELLPELASRPEIDPDLLEKD